MLGTRYEWLSGKGLVLLPSLAIGIAASVVGFGVVGALVMWSIVVPVVVGGLWLTFAIARRHRVGSRGFVDVPCAWFEADSDSYHAGRISETGDGLAWRPRRIGDRRPQVIPWEAMTTVALKPRSAIGAAHRVTVTEGASSGTRLTISAGQPELVQLFKQHGVVVQGS